MTSPNSDGGRCESCRWWSQIVAEGHFALDGSMIIEALCENMNGPLKGKMTKQWQSCPAWQS